MDRLVRTNPGRGGGGGGNTLEAKEESEEEADAEAQDEAQDEAKYEDMGLEEHELFNQWIFCSFHRKNVNSGLAKYFDCITSSFLFISIASNTIQISKYLWCLLKFMLFEYFHFHAECRSELNINKF